MKKEKNRKKLIIMNLCLALLLAVIAGTIAAYTSLSSAKRVVSTKGSTQLFSSNVLYSFKNGETPSSRAMSFSTSTTSNSFTFNVCNYAQGAKTTWSNKNINYSLSIEILDSSNAAVKDNEILKDFEITRTESGKTTADTTVTLDNWVSGNTYKLSTGASCSEDEFEISFPTKYIGTYKIKIVASSDVTGYTSIGRIISTSEASASTHWTGTFTDSIVGDESHKPSELGSVNVKISGQENEYMIITWDTDYFEIDPWFLKDLEKELSDCKLSNYELTTETSSSSTVESESGDSKSGSSGNVTTLKFEVGSIDQPNQYYISFFRTQSAKTLDESWDQMKSHISFSYVAKVDSSASNETNADDSNETDDETGDETGDSSTN
jgi:hypothetical protein